MYDYLGLEGFYQQSGQRKRSTSDGSYKTEFLAYGLDLYGYEPILCGNVNLLGSLGLANYRVRFKYPDISGQHQNRIGYRFGIGAQYNLTENWAVRVMGRYNYLGMDRLNNLKEVTAGLRYTF
jgi:opacity protein-like surface antigen